MRRFIKQILFFCGIFLVYSIIFSILTVVISRKKYGNAIISDRKITTLIIGDSHTELGINDSLLINTRNLSTPAEGYIFSYLKLSSILKNNDQIKNIMLGVSYHNFSSYYDKYIYGEKPYNLISQHISLLENRDLLMLISNNPSITNLIDILRNSVKNIIKYKKYEFPYFGGFHIIKSQLLLDSIRISRRIQGQYYLDNKLLESSSININYLRKIVDLCRDKKIEISIINTPLYKDYYSKIPIKIIEEYNATIKDLCVTEINLNELKLTSDCFLPDGDHLNFKGAILTTKYLIESLKSNSSHSSQ